MNQNFHAIQYYSHIHNKVLETLLHEKKKTKLKCGHRGLQASPEREKDILYGNIIL